VFNRQAAPLIINVTDGDLTPKLTV